MCLLSHPKYVLDFCFTTRVTILNYYFTDEDNWIIVETSEIKIFSLLVLEINETMSEVPSNTGLYKD